MRLIEIDDSTVFVEHPDRTPLQSQALYDTIDWLALAKQKLDLLQRIDADKPMTAPHPLDGLVTLLDALQDDAEARGYPVVWFYALDDWRNGEIENDG